MVTQTWVAWWCILEIAQTLYLFCFEAVRTRSQMWEFYPEPQTFHPFSTTAVDADRNILSACRVLREFSSSRRISTPTRRPFASSTTCSPLARNSFVSSPHDSKCPQGLRAVNDRGLGLNAMDLLKNLLFMRRWARTILGLRSAGRSWWTHSVLRYSLAMSVKAPLVDTDLSLAAVLGGLWFLG